MGANGREGGGESGALVVPPNAGKDARKRGDAQGERERDVDGGGRARAPLLHEAAGPLRQRRRCQVARPAVARRPTGRPARQYRRASGPAAPPSHAYDRCSPGRTAAADTDRWAWRRVRGKSHGRPYVGSRPAEPVKARRAGHGLGLYSAQPAPAQAASQHRSRPGSWYCTAGAGTGSTAAPALHRRAAAQVGSEPDCRPDGAAVARRGAPMPWQTRPGLKTPQIGRAGTLLCARHCGPRK